MKNITRKNLLQLLITIFLIEIIVIFPLFNHGLSGDMTDLLYHLIRIEGVKNSLIIGDYPCKIYYFVYRSYGYGSPLFYPDIFLLIPALARLIGFGPIASFKILVIISTFAITISTYFSFKYICRSHFYSIVGTYLIVLSQFYLADIHYRIGLSEYISFIFLPVLFAAIYDYFVYEGKKIYLFGISMCGLLLTHTIMFFLALVLVISIFFISLFKKKYRMKIFSLQFLYLLLCALLSIGVVAYYIFPMIEQMRWGVFKYTQPWAYIGDLYQPFYTFFLVKGNFNVIAYVGIGIPIIASVIILILLLSKISNNNHGKTFLIAGLLLCLIMTKIFPWKLMNNTIFNMIQFTYRLYPIALLCIVIGIILLLSNNINTGIITSKRIGIFAILLSIIFGIIQNSSIVTNPKSLKYDEEYLYFNSYGTSAGEWLPIDIDPEVTSTVATRDIITLNGETIPFETNEKKIGEFLITNSDVITYRIPRICYKGYRITLVDSDYLEYELVPFSQNGVLHFTNTTNKAGTVYVKYEGTLVQKISNYISIISIILSCIILIRLKSKKNVS